MSPSRQAEVEHWERKLYDYKERHFELSARVHISHLVFETGFRRQMDGRQNIRRLKQMMKIQGCQRLMRDNHVPVIVPRAHWQDRVRPRSGSGVMSYLGDGVRLPVVRVRSRKSHHGCQACPRLRQPVVDCRCVSNR